MVVARSVISVDHELAEIETVADRVALGDLRIRQRFASTVLWLFVVTNAFVLTALGILYWQDLIQLRAGHSLRPIASSMPGS